MATSATQTKAVTSPLRPKRRSAPASTNADPAQVGNGQSSSPTPPIAVVNQAGPSSASSSTSHLRPHVIVRPKILTIHTSDFSSPSSSPGHSPPSRIRPLPRVPDTASSECSSFSPRPLPPTPASSTSSTSSCSSSSSCSLSPPPSTSTSTTFRQALVLSPDQLPRRKESLAPLFTPHIVLPAEEKLTSSHGTRSPPVDLSYTARRGYGVLGKASGGLEVIPPSPASTTVSALIFRRASPDDSDIDSDDDKVDTKPGVRAKQGRCTPVIDNYALSPPPSSSGHSFSSSSTLQPIRINAPRESRHWYREENGILVEQDYDQVLRSLRSLR